MTDRLTLGILPGHYFYSYLRDNQMLFIFYDSAYQGTHERKTSYKRGKREGSCERQRPEKAVLSNQAAVSGPASPTVQRSNPDFTAGGSGVLSALPDLPFSSLHFSHGDRWSEAVLPRVVYISQGLMGLG